MGSRRDEQGAVAVLVAIMTVLLFTTAAFTVDLSNAFVRKRDVQRQADFAALAGGAELGAEKSGTVPVAVVNAVVDSLNGPGDLNLPQDDEGRTAVTATDLTDLDLLNGEVRFNPDPAIEGLQVIAPQVQVDYGFAGVISPDFNDGEVRADATVGVFSPGFGVMPVYAVDGCDWGKQAITDPASGASPAIPPLAYDTDTNATTLESLTPFEVAVNASGIEVTLEGKNFNNTTKVGFFRADDTDPSLVVPLTTFTPTPPYTKGGAGSITFTVPTTVTSVETAWYVRVFNAGSVNKWSARSEAQPLRVGEAVLECSSTPSDGNFGTLKLPRNNPTADSSWTPVNFAEGLEAPLTLAVHAGADASGLCVNGVNGAIESIKPSLLPSTNCVDTDTGLTANVATDGLVNGYSGYPGRLEASSSSISDGMGCAPGGSSSARTVYTPGAKTINNDTLSCFLTDGTTSLADIASPGYSDGPVISKDIYKSPRFYWQPVLKVEPVSGGSNRYSIVDFRAAFITDEVVATSTIRGTNTASADNGIKMEANQVKQVKVIFFNVDALSPDDSGGVVTPYLGVGPRILRLID
jgi:hypothetical protein